MPRVAVFDVLGTVLDERSGFRAATASLRPTLVDPVAAAERWLDRVSTDVSQIATGAAPWRPWEQVIAEAVPATGPDIDLERQGHGLRTVGRRLPAWPDSRAGIEAIRDNHRVVALSNAGIGALVECSRTAGITWDAVLSAEMVHSAKPDPRVYRFLLEQLGADAAEPGEVVMVAAHPWDLRAAAAHGLRTAYVHRPGEGSLETGEDFDWTAGDLLDLAAALTA